MFGVAKFKMMRPGHQLGRVGLHVLDRFGKHAVERPDGGIGGEHDQYRPLPPRRIGKRVDQSLDGPENGSKETRCKLHCLTHVRSSHGRGGTIRIV